MHYLFLSYTNKWEPFQQKSETLIFVKYICQSCGICGQMWDVEVSCTFKYIVDGFGATLNLSLTASSWP